MDQFSQSSVPMKCTQSVWTQSATVRPISTPCNLTGPGVLLSGQSGKVPVIFSAPVCVAFIMSSILPDWFGGVK